MIQSETLTFEYGMPKGNGSVQARARPFPPARSVFASDILLAEG